jgi:hypothetical protein
MFVQRAVDSPGQWGTLRLFVDPVGIHSRIPMDLQTNGGHRCLPRVPYRERLLALETLLWNGPPDLVAYASTSEPASSPASGIMRCCRPPTSLAP